MFNGPKFNQIVFNGQLKLWSAGATGTTGKIIYLN